MTTISRAFILLVIGLPSCSSMVGDNYERIGNDSPRSNSQDFYISEAKKAIIDKALNLSLQTYGAPDVFKRTGLKYFLMKDQIKVRWVKSKDHSFSSGNINPITVGMINAFMTNSGEVIDLDHKEIEGDFSNSQSSIDEY